MFNLFGKKTKNVEKDDKNSNTALQGEILASSFLRVMTEGRNAIPVVAFKEGEKTKFAARGVESQFSGLSPEEFIMLYEIMKLRITNMEKAIKVYEKYHAGIVELANGNGVKGTAFPEEVSTKIKEASEGQLEARKRVYNTMVGTFKKLERMHSLVVNSVETVPFDNHMLIED